MESFRKLKGVIYFIRQRLQSNTQPVKNAPTARNLFVCAPVSRKYLKSHWLLSVFLIARAWRITVKIVYCLKKMWFTVWIINYVQLATENVPGTKRSDHR